MKKIADAGLFAAALLLALTLLRVTDAWSMADSVLAWATVSLTVMALLTAAVFKSHLRLNAIDAILIGWYLYICGGAWILTGYPSAATLLKWTVFVSLYVSLRVIFSRGRIDGDIIASGMVVVALAEACIGAGQLFGGHSHHWRYAATGTFFNPGPYGTMLAVGLVLLVDLRRRHGARLGRVAEWIYFAMLFVLTAMLGVSCSRAAWLGVAVGLLLIYRHELRRYLLLGIPLILIGVIGLYMMKQGSADGRLLIWSVSADNIVSNPFFGSGTGSFFQRYAEGLARMAAVLPDGEPASADVLDYAMNDLIIVGVEQGLLGILFAISLAVMLLISALRCRSALIWVLPVLVVTSIFSYTFELMPFQIMAVVTMAWLASQKEADRPGRRAALVCALLGIVLSGIALQPINHRVAATLRYDAMRGVTHISFIPAYYELLPLMDDNRHYLFDFAKALRAAGRYNDSNAMLRMGACISNDPMFLVVQGNNYADIGAVDKSETAYLRAFDILPNRLYPLYRLMLLYEQTGRIDDARRMARRVIGFTEKVSSPAVREMKQNARDLISDAGDAGNTGGR